MNRSFQLAILVFVLGGSGVWLALRGGQPAPEPPPASVKRDALPPLPANVDTVANSVASTGPLKASAATGTSAAWQRALTSSNPYAEVIRLRNLRERGSFAVAREVLLTCGQFWHVSSTNSPTMASTNVNSPVYGARQAAKTTLETRCAPFQSEHIFELTKPLSDDPEGVQFDAALQYSYQPDSRLKGAKATEMMLAFVDQGRPDLLLDPLRLARSPLRKTLNVSDDELSAAADVVKLRLTSAPEMAQQDLRLVFNCFRWLRCQYSYDELPDYFSDEQRKRILQAADQLEAAMRGGDVVKQVLDF